MWKVLVCAKTIHGYGTNISWLVGVPSVLWRCWLGGRKGVRPVKNLSGVILAWLSVWSEMQTCIRSRWCHCHSQSLAPVKSRLVLPFWYRLTWVVLGKGPLNGCVCSCCSPGARFTEYLMIYRKIILSLSYGRLTIVTYNMLKFLWGIS